jgi:hypothetical protein
MEPLCLIHVGHKRNKVAIVNIAGRDYLLPVEASVLLDTGSHHVWNRMQFHDYQKFGADSTITFGSEPPAK